MKKLTTLFILLLTAVLMITAQPPQAFKYKAIARNKYGMLIINQTVAIRISLLQGSETGMPVYVETHTPASNLFGVIELEIGRGIPASGSFESIDWSVSDYYIKVEMDPKNKPEKNYTVIGTSQLLSVPYALYAGHVKNSEDNDADPLNELITNAYLSGTMLTLQEGGTTTLIDLSGLQDGTEDADADPENEIQDLQLVDNILTITKNGTATEINLSIYLDDTDTHLTEEEVDAMVSNNGYLTSEVDGNEINEIQDISIEGHMLTISGGGTVQLPDSVNDADHDPFNELQELALNGTELTITDKNTVDLAVLQDGVNDADFDPTNELQLLSIGHDTIYLSGGGYVKLPAMITYGGQYYYLDKDNDGYGNQFTPVWIPTGVTEPNYFVSNSADCNDGKETINPSATENMYDALDNDCDGEIDEDLYPELNYTGKWRVETVDMQSCPFADITYFRIEQNGGNIKLYLPGISQPFSGSVVNGHDINISCYYSYSLTIVISGTFTNLNNFTGYINISSSCHTEGQFSLTAFRTNDADQDGYTEGDGDCNDYNGTINPGATEVWGDGYDNDCDGVVDEYLYPELDYTGTWRITPVINMQNCSYEDISYFIIEQTGGVIKCFFPEITSQAFNGSVGNGHDVYIGGAYLTLSLIISGTFTDSDNLTGTISFSSNCGLSGSYTFSAVRSNDIDQDGYSEEEGDCNDYDGTINPGATEVCGDGIDQDCDGQDLDCDTDGDGINDPADNCPGVSNPEQLDSDGDGVGDICESHNMNPEELKILLETSFETFNFDEIINADPALFDYFENHLNCNSTEPDDSWSGSGWFIKRPNCNIYECGFLQSTNYNNGFGVRKSSSLLLDDITVWNIHDNNSGSDLTIDMGIFPVNFEECMKIPISIYCDVDNECLGDTHIKIGGNVMIDSILIYIRVLINFDERSMSFASSEVALTGLNISFDSSEPFIQGQESIIKDSLISFTKDYLEGKIAAEFYSVIHEVIWSRYLN